MKKTSKTILALGAALAVTAAAGTTATFAWFRTIRTASMNIADASIWGDGDLKVGYLQAPTPGYGAVGAPSANTTNGFDLTGATNSATDVSGNGINLFKPTWDPNEDETALSIAPVANSSTKTYFVQFGMELTRTGTESFSVYLNQGCSVLPSDPSVASDVQSAKAIRIAFWSGSSVISTWQPDNTDGNDAASYKYLAAGETSDTAYGVKGYKFSSPEASNFHVGSFPKISTKSEGDAVSGAKIATLSNNNPVNVFCTIWIEGTLSSATKACVNGMVDIKLNLVAC